MAVGARGGHDNAVIGRRVCCWIQKALGVDPSGEARVSRELRESRRSSCRACSSSLPPRLVVYYISAQEAHVRRPCERMHTWNKVGQKIKLDLFLFFYSFFYNGLINTLIQLKQIDMGTT